MNPIQTEAMRLQGAGFSIIPVFGKNKPALKWKSFQKLAPSAEQVAGWFSIFRDCNFAVITGFPDPSGKWYLIVVDADSPDAQEWIAGNLPQTSYQVHTARGLHYYYRCNFPFKNLSNKALKIDVRGKGGYVIGATSIHPTGAIYSYINGSPQSIEELPEITLNNLLKIAPQSKDTPLPSLTIPSIQK